MAKYAHALGLHEVPNTVFVVHLKSCSVTRPQNNRLDFEERAGLARLASMVLFTSRRRQPPRVSTDEVLPARFFDDSPMVRDVVMRWLVQFDDVLDPHQLHSSLDTLLKMKSWRRLGGRFRRNSNGGLEIHVPEEYDTNRPSLRFSHASFDMSISDHALASRLPQPTKEPSIQVGGDIFRDLKAREDVPSTLEDYIFSDDPPLELHVFTFTDATIVTLNFPHALTDAMGLSELIKNWCRVLACQIDDVIPLSQDDPLDHVESEEGLGESKTKESHVLAQNKIAGWSLFFFALYFVWDLISGPTMETKTICLPERSVTALKAKALDDIRSQYPTFSTPDEGIQNNLKNTFVSEGDILSAWGTKMIGLGLGPRFNRTIAVMNVFELRSRLKKTFDSSSAHVQNAFFVLTTILTGQETRNLPVGQLALRLRSSLMDQTTETQVRALIREQRASMKKHDRPVLFAKRNSILLPMSDWSKARFFDIVDFGPAVITKTGSGLKNGLGRPKFFLAFDANPKVNPTHRNVFNIIGKDSSGNCWITGMLSPATWVKVKQEFEHI